MNLNKKHLSYIGAFIVVIFLVTFFTRNVGQKQVIENSTTATEMTTTTSSSEKKNIIDSVIDTAKEATKPIVEEVKESKYVSDITNQVKNAINDIEGSTTSQSTSIAQSNDQDLANIEYTGEDSVPVNNNVSSLTWDWDTNKIVYSPLDHLNRVGSAKAYLSKVNYGKSEGREGQKWQPTGWNNQKRNQDRGHLIAYTLSFNFNDDGVYTKGELGSIDNPKNLFTQTSQSNRGVMQDFEEIVREAIKANKKVIYEVTPVFKDDELMARGVHVQAISEDGSVNFNQYIFNIDDDYNFDYATGKSTKK